MCLQHALLAQTSLPDLVRIADAVAEGGSGPSAAEREGGRPTSRRSWHELLPERDKSDWAGVMQNGSHTTDDERGGEGGRRAMALGRGGEEGWRPVEHGGECRGAVAMQQSRGK